MCLQCEEDTSPKGLAAVPGTPFCIRCQEIAGRSQAAAPATSTALLGNAV